MINSDQIDDIVSKITAALPSGFKPELNSGIVSGFQSLQQDAEKNIRLILQASFEKMQLVSREEFDIQSRLLQRTREKLDLLELRVNQLGSSIDDSK